jgi:uncharacterized protein (DUF2336 family)
VIKGDADDLITVVNNPGAAISDPSFEMLIDKSAGNNWLSECIARRKDIPEHHFRELVSKASEVVRQRLMTTNPEQSEIIQELFPAECSVACKQETKLTKDYRTAELVVNSRPLTEAVVFEFATAKRVEEIIVSIAQLSGLSTTDVERLFIGPWSSPVAVILKAIGFHLATIDAIYRARLSLDERNQNDLVRTKAEFIAISRATAERIMRFYCTRKSVEFAEHSYGSLASGSSEVR